MSGWGQVDRAKQQAREQVWELLERERAVPEQGVWGRIPNFVGAARAADRLADLPQWQAARVVKANPDRAQLPVRQRALETGKTVFMAVPNLADPRPFYLLDPDRLAVPAEQAAESRYAATAAPKIAIDEITSLEFVVCGSVAVNRNGVRLGKGAGYSDIEVALLAEAGLVGPSTTIVTTVHTLQVIDRPLPETEHDFRVDLVVTSDEVIMCGPPRRPNGLLWDHLTPEKIASIPALAARSPQR